MLLIRIRFSNNIKKSTNKIWNRHLNSVNQLMTDKTVLPRFIDSELALTR